MKIGRFKFSKRAVSPVIATLLMIAIAVAASIIVYVWSIGLLGGLMGSGGSQTKEQLIMEAYNWGTGLSFTLRNVGSAPVTVAAIYLGGTALPGVGTATLVGIGTSVPFSGTPASGTYTPGAAYTLKVVSSNGGVFAFSVIDGSAG